MTDSRKVAVLMGGHSVEREVSLVTGDACATALGTAGFDVVRLDAAADDLVDQLRTVRPDVVFNALHGRYGEDGCVQGMLELLSIPYTHSGVLASSLAMDKIMTKKVYQHAGLPTPSYRSITGREEIGACDLPPPCVVKPVNEGSSVGVVLMRKETDSLPSQLDAFSGRLMVEEYVPGTELTVSVLGDRPLAVTEIVSSDWYDYEAKYSDGGSRHILPAGVPDEIHELSLQYSLAAHRVLGCRGLSRTDLRWNPELGPNGLFLLETNTQPGMTPTSLSPEQAAHCGISLPELCRILVEDASCGS